MTSTVFTSRPAASLLAGILASVLLFLPAPARAVDPLEQALALGEGYNFIALHVVPESLPTSAQLLETGKAVSVFRFDRTSQSFVYQLKLDSGQLFGNSFSLQPGEGYVLKCGADPGTITVSGSEYTGNPLADLVNGFNFIGLYAQRGTMARALVTANPFVESIFRWLKDSGAFGFVLRLPDGALFGDDFAIEAGTGYFLKYDFAQYTLTVTANPLDAGKVLVDPGPALPAAVIEQVYPRGTVVTLRDAIPNDSSRHVFDRWSGTHADQIDTNGQILMNGNREIVAEFRELDPNELPLGKKVQKELPPLGQNGELRFYFFTDSAGDYRVRLRSTRNIQQLVFSIWDGTDTNKVTEYDPTSYDNSWTGSESNSGWYMGTLSDKMKFQQSPEYIHADIKNLKAKTKYWLRVKNSREQSPAVAQNEMVEASVEYYPARLEFDAVVTTDPNEYSIYADTTGTRYGFVPLTPGVTHFGRVSPYFEKRQFVSSAYTMHYPESTHCYFKFTPDRDGSWSLTLSDWEYKDYSPIRTPEIISWIKIVNPSGSSSPYDPAVYPDFEQVNVQNDLVPSGKQVIHLHGLKAGLTYYWNMEARGLDSSSAFRAKVEFLKAPDNVGFRIAPRVVDLGNVSGPHASASSEGGHGFDQGVYLESYYRFTGAEAGKVFYVELDAADKPELTLSILQGQTFTMELYAGDIPADGNTGQIKHAAVHQGKANFYFTPLGEFTRMRIRMPLNDQNVRAFTYRMTVYSQETFAIWNDNWGLGTSSDNPLSVNLGVLSDAIPTNSGKDLWIQFLAPPTQGQSKQIRASFFHASPTVPVAFGCYPERVDEYAEISTTSPGITRASHEPGVTTSVPGSSPPSSTIIYPDNPDVPYASGLDGFFQFGYRSDDRFGRIKMKITGGGEGTFVRIRVDALP